MGSTSYITNLDGDVVQHIEYVPFGEVFLEERNNKWNTPYLFNAKELDEETGLYYYGARYYDPRVSLFYGVDKLTEKYPNISAYHYCSNNPVNRIDPTGLYDIDAIEINKQYGTVAVYATGTEKDEVLAIDINAAKEAGVPVIYVDNIADYKDAMAAIGGRGASTETYTLNSHGSVGSFEIGSDRVTDKTDFSPLKDGLNDKNVFIGACKVTEGGNAKGTGLIEKLSTQTKSTVFASDHDVNAGYSYDGGRALNGTVGKRGAIGNALLGENHQNSFHMTFPEQSAKQVYNVTINKEGNVSWNSGNLSPLRFVQPSPLR